MGWTKWISVAETRRALLEMRAAGASAYELALHFGVSPSTVNRLVARCREFGVEAAIVDGSRAPKNMPHALTTNDKELILCLRSQFEYGPKKLAILFSENFERSISKGAVANLLAELSLVRSYRRRQARPSLVLTTARACNDVWGVDFKGDMGPQRLEPLTVIDHHSRFWLCCRVFADQSYEDTRKAFEPLFAQYGLPRVIRVDAGVPWVSVTSWHRLTRLSAWWIALGIRVEIVSSCQENGIAERLHLTMEQEMSIDGIVDVERHFAVKRDAYNRIRPHESLDMRRPADVYTRSDRRLLEVQPSYEANDVVRSVGTSGEINWQGRIVFISEALIGRRVGLRRIGDDVWQVRYFEHLISTITSADGRLAAKN